MTKRCTARFYKVHMRMLTTTRGNFVTTLLFVCLAAGVHGAVAHTYQLALGPDAGATDYFGVICSAEGGADADHLYMQIQTNTANAPLVSVQVIKGSTATNTTDPVSGDSEASPPTINRGGNGLYQVLINKAGPGAVVYTVTVHCLDVTGTLHTGTDGVVYQY
jgi:hypothetical protein